MFQSTSRPLTSGISVRTRTAPAKIRKAGIQRYSESKDEWIPVEDMNLYHLVNALRSDIQLMGTAEQVTENAFFQAAVKRLAQAIEDGEIEEA